MNETDGNIIVLSVSSIISMEVIDTTLKMMPVISGLIQITIGILTIYYIYKKTKKL